MTTGQQIRDEIIQAIKAKVFPGCVVGLVTAQGDREVVAAGNFTYETSPKVTEDTIYDTASLTKSIPTTSLALQLIDQGRLGVTDKLIDHMPEFRNKDRELVLVKHLLTYGLDGYGLSSLGITSLHDVSAERLVDIFLTKDFEHRPGTVFKYSNTPCVLLGMMLEKVYDTTLDVIAGKNFFKPLAMTRSTFFPEHFSKEDIAPTEIDDQRGVVWGVVHDETAYICKRGGKIMGHAGLFSTAPDILNFLEMLLHSGTFKGQEYFSEQIVKEMGENQIAELNDFAGLGWELNQPRYMSSYCSEHTFGKTGFTGTLVVCDLQKGVAYVILSNRTYPKRPTDSTAINAFRKKIGEIILA